MSRLTAALIGVSVLLLVLATWAALGAEPRDLVGQFPLGADATIPSISLIAAAGAVAVATFVGLAALHAAAAMRVLARDRRIPHRLSPEMRKVRSLLLTPMGPSTVRMLEEPELPTTRLQPAGHGLRLTVFLPAHNEELTIAAALESLWGQTRPPDRVVVVADNCTDDTSEIARRHGADVFTTVGNTDKKGGALNQALSALFAEISLPRCRDGDGRGLGDRAGVPRDGDGTPRGGSRSDRRWRRVLRRGWLRAGRPVAAQRVHPLSAPHSRQQGKVFVLTGTASLFRTYALKAVADCRGQLLPGDPGQVYDTLALTEDNEMTLSLKSLGAKMVSPMQCRVVTEVMPSWRALWRQRMRWQRGALENIGAYGLTRATLRYWLQQIAIGYGAIALNAYFLLLLITLVASDSFEFVWFWALIGLIFVVERVVTVWAVGWRGRAIAFPLVVESHTT